jgi:hypothetical protein
MVVVPMATIVVAVIRPMTIVVVTIMIVMIWPYDWGGGCFGLWRNG